MPNLGGYAITKASPECRQNNQPEVVATKGLPKMLIGRSYVQCGRFCLITYSLFLIGRNLLYWALLLMFPYEHKPNLITAVGNAALCGWSDFYVQ